ncbi:hypothetical protein FISHEDRAFT_57107 [Fistulina hepatica ATCC 64428]|nr:hypothetical protein FISHEDRAFT_57107 [Fistulina hepatica ATCC 64428]
MTISPVFLTIRASAFCWFFFPIFNPSLMQGHTGFIAFLSFLWIILYCVDITLSWDGLEQREISHFSGYCSFGAVYTLWQPQFECPSSVLSSKCQVFHTLILVAIWLSTALIITYAAGLGFYVYRCGWTLPDDDDEHNGTETKSGRSSFMPVMNERPISTPIYATFAATPFTHNPAVGSPSAAFFAPARSAKHVSTIFSAKGGRMMSIIREEGEPISPVPPPASVSPSSSRDRSSASMNVGMAV